MANILPINLNDLLYLRGVESARVEFKAAWDEKTTGWQIIRTICAFANDFQNLNGGYIVLGIEEQGSKAILPPRGVPAVDLEKSQKWIRGKCNDIDPVYQPVFSPEVIDGKEILVIWVPASDSRPHQARGQDKDQIRHYWIRSGSESVDAAKYPELLTTLMQQTARVPFDDRRALHSVTEDIRETKVREFLRDIGSDLVNEPDTKTLYRNLRIASPVNGHDAPKNVGLLFFSQDPEQWFPGARIEVVQYAAGAAGDVIEEKTFRQRPIHEQLRECLAYLENLSGRQIQKLAGQIQATHWVGYPALALREALVNAVYHRSYEGNPEPIKVYLYSDRMEVISYPGPVPGIEARHLDGNASLPPVPARNRRIGEWLKELKLAEGRGTGLPKLRRVMKENGSPPPQFDFDEARSYFRATLPVHPEYRAILALQDVANLKAIGNLKEALNRLQQAFEQTPNSIALALELCREHLSREDVPAAIQVYDRFVESDASQNPATLITLIANALLDTGHQRDATQWLDRLPMLSVVEDAFNAAIAEKRAGRFEKAHKYFQIAGDAVTRDVKALHEYAQVKMRLAAKALNSPSKDWRTNKRLLSEAKEMLQRIVQMEAPRTRHAWAWHDLGQVRLWLREPQSEIRRAFEQAALLAPEEPRFQDALNRMDMKKA